MHYLPVLGMAFCFAASLIVILGAAISWSRQWSLGSRAALTIGLPAANLAVWMFVSRPVLYTFGVEMHAGYVLSLYALLISVAVVSSGVAMSYVIRDLPADMDIRIDDLLARNL